MNFFIRSLTVSLVLPLGLGMKLAFAQSSSPILPSTTESLPQNNSNTSTLEISEQNWAKIKERLILNYWGVFSGPPVGKISSYNPGSEGEEGGPLNLDGAVSVGYRPLPNISTSVGIPFIYQPVLKQTVTFKDSYFKVSHNKIFNRGNFNLAAGLRAYIPTTDASKDKGYRGGVRFEQIASYALGNSGLELGTYTFVRRNAYATGRKGTVLSLYAAPFANYKLTEKLTATIWTDLVQLGRPSGTSFSTVENDPITTQVGLNWDVSKNLSLNPYINFYPENPSQASSSFGMIVSAVVL